MRRHKWVLYLLGAFFVGIAGYSILAIVATAQKLDEQTAPVAPSVERVVEAVPPAPAPPVSPDVPPASVQPEPTRGDPPDPVPARTDSEPVLDPSQLLEPAAPPEFGPDNRAKFPPRDTNAHPTELVGAWKAEDTYSFTLHGDGVLEGMGFGGFWFRILGEEKRVYLSSPRLPFHEASYRLDETGQRLNLTYVEIEGANGEINLRKQQ